MMAIARQTLVDTKYTQLLQLVIDLRLVDFAQW